MKRHNMRIKACFLWVIILITVIGTQGAYASGRSYIACDCIFGDCECFIQLGDEGGAVKEIVKKLIAEGYLPKKTPKGEYTVQVENAVKQFQADHKLDITGTMDDDTLTLLIWGMLPEELDIINSEWQTVYIPTDGGKKRHLNMECSRMEDPRKISERNAEELGFEPCKKCFNRSR